MIQSEKVKDYRLVSIVMLSHNKAQYVKESVMSVIDQTYKNWELLFLDNNSKDDTITKMMDLKDEAKIKNEDGTITDRIKVSKTVSDRGSVINRNSSLKEARGRWIAFLNVGDVWAPDKLEKQIRFMEENDYAFSYHQYRLMDSNSKDRGFLISGKTHVTHSDMLKCCWPGYLTVMYDAAKIGKVRERSSWTNDYALWLCISDKTDLYLLPESLATMRTKWKKLGNILLTNNTKWRYDAYRMEEDLGRFTSFFYTIRNGWYGIVKWLNYVKKDNKQLDKMAERKRIYLCLAHMSEDGAEQRYVKEAFDTNWVVPLGPNVNGFEADLEAFVGQDKRVVALASGTSAVHLALIACGVKPGDEVIVQSFTFCASSHPITYLGATPVFVDSEKDTWNMDPELMEEAIKDRVAKTGKTPKAIVPVALYGMPYKIDRIMEIANKFDIPVIEDAAEGFGSRYNGQVLGTFGKYGVLSFNGNKMITTSGGGALITNNEDEWREIMMYATQYRESYPYYQHEKIGFNYRMSNICAGIGRGQMTVANEHIAHHKHVQALYEELLGNVHGITVHSQPKISSTPGPSIPELSSPTRSLSQEAGSPVYDSNYWLCTITIDPNLKIKGQENAYKTIVTGAVGGAAGVIHAASSAITDCQPNDNVEALRVALDQAGIEARPVWKPMHKQPCYKDAPAYTNGVSEAIFKVGMCLPAGPYVSDDDVRYIVETIKANIMR